MKNIQKATESITAFRNEAKLVSGLAWDVALVVRNAMAADTDDHRYLCFNDRSGDFVDLDLSGTDADIVARLKPLEIQAETQPEPEAKVRPGRPKLGVVSKEVTLLPRHWDWLAQQSGGASATLRKLVEVARKANAGAQRAQQAKAAADNFMRAMLGEQTGYEEAARALYRDEESRFAELINDWPTDLRDHVLQLASAGGEAEQIEKKP